MLAECAFSQAGNKLLYYHNGANAPGESIVFATGLRQPYGIAFYPPGNNPEWIYICNHDGVVRFPYHSGDQQASGSPETIVVLTSRHG